MRYTVGRRMNRARVEKIGKALSDRTRLRIFESISREDQMNCGDIVSMRGVSHATVSHHLKVLSDAGLIDCRRQGQFVYRRAIPETLEEYARALMKLARAGR